jgi:hypothetical protein
MSELLDAHPFVLFAGIVVIFLAAIVVAVTLISRLYRV